MTTKQESKLLNSRYLMLSVINLIISISFSMVYTSIQKYAMGLGIATAVAGLITGAFNIASMAIRPFSGLISDRINRKLLLIIATFGMGLSIFGYLFITAVFAWNLFCPEHHGEYGNHSRNCAVEAGG